MKINPSRISLIKPALAAITLLGALAAQASTSYFTTPTFRGQTDTAAAYWESFTSAYAGANPPNGIPLGGGTLASATLTQTASPTAFLTGAGNIYDFSAATGFTLNESAGFNIGEVLFQTRTLGSTLDYNSVALTYDLGSGPTSLFGTRTALTDPAGGDSSLWTWDLSAFGNVNNFSLGFNASASSMSFDAAVLDVRSIQPVPEPGPMAMLALGGLSLAFVRRFRSQPSL